MNENNIRVSREQVRQGEPQMSGNMRGGSRANAIVVAVAIVVVALLGVLLFRDKIIGSKTKDGSSATSEKSGEYQAMFLTNGQVYFGKIAPERGEYVKLTDIFYLQVTPVQGSQTEPRQQPTLQLVKLGNELHGPVDEMHINRDHILFFEDLKDDGKVVQAIKDYKANPNRGTGGTGGTQSQQQQQQGGALPVQQTQPTPSSAGTNLNNTGR